MKKLKADSYAVQLIYKLANDSDRVFTMGRSYRDLMRLGLKVEDVCDAIQTWIDSGKEVLKDETKHDPHFRGSIIYIFEHCDASGIDLYIKVEIRKNINTGEYLMIISAHEPKY